MVEKSAPRSVAAPAVAIALSLAVIAVAAGPALAEPGEVRIHREGMESRVLPPKVRPPEPEVEEIGTKSRVYSPDVSAFGRPADEEGAAPDGSLADFGFAQGPAQPPAQQPGQTPDAGKIRAQGRDLVPPGIEQPNAPRRGLIDYAEEMRKFVQRISAYVRKQRPNFVVVARNGLELINRIGPEDPPKSAPARTYLGALDGVLVDSLFYGAPHVGRKAPAQRRKRRLRLAEQAKADGLRVLVLDHVTRRPDVRKSYRLSAARGYAWFAAYARGKSLNRIPPYPRRPFNEKAESVLSLRGVRNFLFLDDSAAFGRQDEFTLRLHQTNYDMVVVDVFHAGRPLSQRAVQTLKYKKIGGRRLVLAQMNIGTAARYRYYWKAKWRQGSPVWISAPTPGDPDRYYVEYWRPEWQKIITGDTRSYAYGIIDLGFDGVVLSGLESYRFFQNPNEQGEDR